MINFLIVINNLPTTNLGDKSSLQIIFNKSRNYKFFKVFGCVYFPNLRSYNNHKFSLYNKGYLCLNPNDVIFYDDDFSVNKNIALKTNLLFLLILLTMFVFN